MSLLLGARNIMLNKECCKKCRKRFGIFGWMESDELWWKEEGMVYCPDEYLGKKETVTRKITGQPPIKCPFLLEHTISNEDII